MEVNIKVKEEFLAEVVGFRNSGIPLGDRSQEDLRWLVEQGQTVNPSLLRFFEDPPSLEEISGLAVEDFLIKTEPALPAMMPIDQPIKLEELPADPAVNEAALPADAVAPTIEVTVPAPVPAVETKATTTKNTAKK